MQYQRKKNELMPSAATWTDLEITIQVRQRQISYDITYMWNLKKKKKNIFTKQKQIPRHGKQTYGYQRGNMGRGINQEFGLNRYTPLYVNQMAKELRTRLHQLECL